MKKGNRPLASDEESIFHSSEFLNTVLENLHSSVFVLSRQRKIQSINTSGIALLDKGHHAVINQLFGNALDCMNTEQGTINCGYSDECQNCSLLKAVNRIFSKENHSITQVYDKKIIQRNGKAFRKFFLYSAKTIYFQQKEMVLLIVDDITEREEQKEKLNRKNEEIYSSFRYAKRIQKALLPNKKDLEETLKNHFLFYQPQNIIGGDFYWTHANNGFPVFSVADCTGHGIPGALITMLGITALNDIVINHQVSQPDHVLNKLRKQIVGELNDTNQLNQYDGMDISFCKLDPANKTIQFSGANSKAILFHKGQIIEFRGNNMPVGPFFNEREFTLQTLNYDPGDMLYLFSDGYKDQFGGKEDKKFGKKRFLKLLQAIHKMEVSEQEKRMAEKFNQWKEGYEQIDDVTVLAVQLN